MSDGNKGFGISNKTLKDFFDTISIVENKSQEGCLVFFFTDKTRKANAMKVEEVG